MKEGKKKERKEKERKGKRKRKKKKKKSRTYHQELLFKSLVVDEVSWLQPAHWDLLVRDGGSRKRAQAGMAHRRARKLRLAKNNKEYLKKKKI